MVSLTDNLAIIKALVEPLASQAGFFKNKILGMITEENIREMYASVGEDGVRLAADAIIRIGKGGE